MSANAALSVALVTCAASALSASVYLAVRPRPTSSRGRIRPLSPFTWHLVRGALTVALASAAAGFVLTVVSLQPT